MVILLAELAAPRLRQEHGAIGLGPGMITMLPEDADECQVTTIEICHQSQTCYTPGMSEKAATTAAEIAPPTEADAPTRRLILEATKANLRRFGADKTTVVDIARALGMSHSNVYRFFRTKAELLDAVVEEWLTEEEALLNAVVAQPGPARERLERLVLTLLARKRAKHTEDTELSALYYRLLSERPAGFQRLETATLATVERIIAEGVTSGELAAIDTAAAARVAWQAVSGFFDPKFVRKMIERTAPAEQLVRDVIQTMIAGFANREHPPRLGGDAAAQD
jgi:AcrR family transcriptional regulator